jgi:hypothetical protein
MTNAPAAPWPAMSIAEAHALLTAPGQPFEMEEMVIGLEKCTPNPARRDVAGPRPWGEGLSGL